MLPQPWRNSTVERRSEEQIARTLEFVEPMSARGGVRPAFFNLLQIRLPVGAVTSILHRLTGVLLALTAPCGVFLLGLSLEGPAGYVRAAALLNAWPSRAFAVAVVWALAHHSLAGVRHLLMDIDLGSALPAARRSAWTVNVAGAALALLAAVAVA